MSAPVTSAAGATSRDQTVVMGPKTSFSPDSCPSSATASSSSSSSSSSCGGSTRDGCSSSPPPSASSPTSSSAIAAVPSAANATPTPRQPLSRRGHFKSRLGCFSCKRRRVKCNELRPECAPCRRLGLTCVYPPAASNASPSASSSNTVGVAAAAALRANPSMLALQDLRFYHQFLTTAFPTLPLRNGQVWSDAAAMSHQYEHLAHALLGLGASNLSQNGNVDYTSQALQHRVVAIKLFNEQLSRPPTSAADADALFATVLCLLTQSSLLSDTMIEYMTMTRGAHLVATSVITDYTTSIFRTFTPQGHIQSLTAVVCEMPKDFAVTDAFRASVASLEPLCHEQTERAYLGCQLRCIDALHESSLAAWKEFVILYMMPSSFSNQEFLSLIDAENHVGRLLVIHMFLLDYILGRFCIAPADCPKLPGRKNVIIGWTRDLAKTLPSEYQKYIQWPLEYCEVLAGLDARYLLSP
ncbi:hypothetical protein JDV02_010736 [Purpureocillium takamizusanense]|uniref:Zn(2)-C6 fungal-type domain-containing protein n=1 Tax=Purpureocillium takamizusanense TaxID=2060973 RepID=A0A9Q8QV25_9HYPO|nr:uncharacterized protein JDV02_010736 [Purpureocillium takamizusanense]UNI25027.1 hypothetical protein JDV02_010736 [Purpureocillium takamizusanense]